MAVSSLSTRFFRLHPWRPATRRDLKARKPGSRRQKATEWGGFSSGSLVRVRKGAQIIKGDDLIGKPIVTDFSYYLLLENPR